MARIYASIDVSDNSCTSDSEFVLGCGHTDDLCSWLIYIPVPNGRVVVNNRVGIQQARRRRSRDVEPANQAHDLIQFSIDDPWKNTQDPQKSRAIQRRGDQEHLIQCAV